MFPETSCASLRGVAEWSFLTNHARVLLCIAHDPGARLRDIAASLGITERSAHGIITDLAKAGYVVKQRDGRRNRYRIEANLPLREPASREPAIGEVLAVLVGSKDGLVGLAGLPAAGPPDGGPADGSDVVTLRAGDPGGPGGLAVTTGPARLRPRAISIPAIMVSAVLLARHDGVDDRLRRLLAFRRLRGPMAPRGHERCTAAPGVVSQETSARHSCRFPASL